MNRFGNTRGLLTGFVTLLGLVAAAGQASAQTWNAAGTGTFSWNTAANWTPTTVPNGTGVTATFSNTGAGATKTVTLDAAITVNALAFNTTQTGNVTINAGTGGPLTLAASGSGSTTVSIANLGSALTHTVNANVVLDRAPGNGTSTHTWNIGTNGTFAVGGNVSEVSGGAKSLTLPGNGTVLLNGANTYTGATTVSGTGTLGGTGSVTSNVFVNSGTITAGAAGNTDFDITGTLSISGGYTVSLFGTTNTDNSRLNVTGAVTINNGTSALQLALGSGVTVASIRASGAKTYTIIDGGSLAAGNTFSTTDFTTAGFLASEWVVTYDTTNGNVLLQFTPVPEPGTVLGIAAAGLAAFTLVRRRTSRAVVPAAA